MLNVNMHKCLVQWTMALLMVLLPVASLTCAAAQASATEVEQAFEAINQRIDKARQRGDAVALTEGQMDKARLQLDRSMFDEAIITANLALLSAKDVKSEKLMERVYRLLSECYMGKHLFFESLDFLYLGCDLAAVLRDTSTMAWYLLSISQNEEYIGRSSNAIAVNIRAIDLFQRTGDRHLLALIYRGQGVAHAELANYSVAVDYISKAIDMLDDLDDSVNLGIAKFNYAELNLLMGDAVRAQHLLDNARQLLKEQSWYGLRAQSLQASIMLYRQPHSEEGISLLQRTAEQQGQAGDVSGQAATLCALGEAYMTQRNMTLAIQNLTRCLRLAHRENLVKFVRKAQRGLAWVYGVGNRYDVAYGYLNRYVAITDSLFNLQSIGEVNRLENQAAIRDKENQIAQQRQLIEANNALIRQGRMKHIFFYVVILLMLGFVGYVVYAYRRQVRQTKELNRASAEIESQNVLLAQQNRDIKDSQNYAKRIQQAMLRSSAQVTDFFSDTFLMFRPRELVSGDFYWSKRVDNLLLFAVADCTGHGTPGAFMSIIGTMGLNQVVTEFNERRPAEILTRLNDMFCHAFEQRAGAEILDGMDIGICCYNVDTRELKFAGANIGLYVLRDASLPPATSMLAMQKNGRALYQTRFDRHSIGYNFDQSKSYSTHAMQLLPGDCLYLLSDGFSDQFGGPKGKKFGQNAMRNLFCDVSHLPMKEQQQRIEQAIDAWKGGYMQVDDITVLGITVQ